LTCLACAGHGQRSLRPHVQEVSRSSSFVEVKQPLSADQLEPSMLKTLALLLLTRNPAAGWHSFSAGASRPVNHARSYRDARKRTNAAILSTAKPEEKQNEVLNVKGLTATIADKEILKGVNLTVRRGEVHAIMGPNGCGKSTFSKVVIGHPVYEVTGGNMSFLGEELNGIEPEDRSQRGIFLAFQYPVEIPGVSNADFLRLAVNKKRLKEGKEEYDPIEFMGVLAEKMETLNMDPAFLGRDVNQGFSGGEKKRNEILQMALLEPELAILDEIDSGLDIDALKQVADGVNAYRSDNNSVVLITHYQRLLNYIKPDFVHVMHQGQIVRSGGPELALELERDGYAFLGPGIE